MPPCDPASSLVAAERTIRLSPEKSWTSHPTGRMRQFSFSTRIGTPPWLWLQSQLDPFPSGKATKKLLSSLTDTAYPPLTPRAGAVKTGTMIDATSRIADGHRPDQAPA